MMLLRTEISPARFREMRNASESNVRTSLSLWHGHGCKERLVGRQVVTTRIQQAIKLSRRTVKTKKKC